MTKLTKEQLEAINDIMLGWFSIGWSVPPEKITVEQAVELMQTTAVAAFMSWQHCVAQGKVPNEDVSPADGFLIIACLLKYLADSAGRKSVSTRTVVKKYWEKMKPNLNKMNKVAYDGLWKIAPGYLDPDVPDADEKEK